MAPTATEIQSLFDRIAPVYDQLNDWLSLGQHHIWKQMAVKWSGAKPGDSCIDLCCGSGDLARRLAQRVGPSGEVVGVDFAAAQLAIAQGRATQGYGIAPIRWVQSDVLALPFPADHFDAATMGYGLRNVVDIGCSLQELRRVLKPGARAAILDFNHSNRPEIRWFQQWYLEQVIVPTAKRFGLTEEYAYLGPSLERFPAGPEQVRISLQVGFSTATHYPIASDTMGVLVVTK